MEVKREGNKVTITVELDTKGRPSSTGKTIVLFTSGGFRWYEDIGVNLTIIKSKRST